MKLNSIFDPNNFFFQDLARLVDIVGLSLAWTFLCLPVVTIGPATAALYHTVVKGLRGKDERVFLRFFRSFRENLKQGLAATAICLVPAGALGLGYSVMLANRGTALGDMMYIIYYVLMMLPIGIACYVFPLLGRFTFTTKDLFRTAARLAVIHLPTTAVVVLVTVESAVFILERWWPACFLPVAAAFVTSLLLERVFGKYLPGEDADTGEETGGA